MKTTLPPNSSLQKFMSMEEPTFSLPISMTMIAPLYGCRARASKQKAFPVRFDQKIKKIRPFGQRYEVAADMLVMRNNIEYYNRSVIVCVLAAAMALALIALPSAAPDASAKVTKKKVDERTLATYKKLRSKDIILCVEHGQVYIMVAPNRWEIAKTNLKLVSGDKLKIRPGTVAIVNFYDEFDMHVPESEMTTIDPAGITQLINGALFQTTYKDGTYVSEVIKEPTDYARYQFRGPSKERDKKLAYSKDTLLNKDRADFDTDMAAKEREQGNYIRARIAQARGFGTGFCLDYNRNEQKYSIDRNIDYLEREKRSYELDVMKRMAVTENYKVVIAKRKAEGLNVSADLATLAAQEEAVRDYSLSLGYLDIMLRNLYEKQNKINLKPKDREW